MYTYMHRKCIRRIYDEAGRVQPSHVSRGQSSLKPCESPAKSHPRCLQELRLSTTPLRAASGIRRTYCLTYDEPGRVALLL